MHYFYNHSNCAQVYLQRELFSEPPVIHLLRLHGVEEWKSDHVRPDRRGRSAADPADQLQLCQLLVSLEDGALGEELPQDTAAAPDVHRGTVPLLPQQELRWPVPEGDDLVGVRAGLVIGMVQPGKTKVS